MAFTNYLEDALLNHIKPGGTTYTQPSNTYAALYTVAPTDSDPGTEVSGNGYARQLVAWGTVAGGQMSNTTDPVSFAAGGAWGDMVAVGVWDAVSGGNLLWYGTLGSTITINDTDVLEFAAGEITLSLD